MPWVGVDKGSISRALPCWFLTRIGFVFDLFFQVVYGCWRTDPSIAAWMAANGFAAGDYDALLAYFVKRADAIVQKLGAQPMHWEEVQNECGFRAGVLVEMFVIASLFHVAI